MPRPFLVLLVGLFAALSAPGGFAQDRAALHSDSLGLSKKLDEQNAKIDALSQQILKLQQTVEQGKTSAAPATTGIPEESAAPVAVPSGNTHVVTRGETLTSIAKQYRVGIEELQKFNHIENERKLQIGQTLAIPGTQTPGPVATPAPATSPNE
jgi:LysM repeat protein